MRSRSRTWEFEGITVDERIAHELSAQGLWFCFDPAADKDYPSVFEASSNRYVCPLHGWVDRFYKGPLPAGLVVHHRDENKFNDTISNLERLTRPGHQRRHRVEARKFSPRKRLDLGGLYRPHAPTEGRTLGLAEAKKLLKRGKLSRPSVQKERPRSLAQKIRDAERLFRNALPALVQATQHLDSGMTIPKVNLRPKGGDVKLGIRSMQRRGCTASEVAYVRAWALHHCDDAEVAEVYGFAPGVVRHIASRYAVGLSKDRFRQYGRLPVFRGKAPNPKS